jgi:hypothetical protein
MDSTIFRRLLLRVKGDTGPPTSGIPRIPSILDHIQLVPTPDASLEGEGVGITFLDDHTIVVVCFLGPTSRVGQR